jgi:hypothetical protein
MTTCFIWEAVWLMEVEATDICHLEEATMLRDLRIGKLPDTTVTEGTILGQSRRKDPDAHLQTLTISNA